MLGFSSLLSGIAANPVAFGQGIAGLFAGSSKPEIRTPPRMANPYELGQGAYDNILKMVEDSYMIEADLYDKQAQIALDESEEEAGIKAGDVKQFRAQQALNYQFQGVTLEGSPMEILNETRRKGEQEVDAILRRGVAQADLLRRQGQIQRNQGRASVLGQKFQYGMSRYSFAVDQIAARAPQVIPAQRDIGKSLGILGQALFSGGGGGGSAKTGPSNPLTSSSNMIGNSFGTALGSIVAGV